MRPRSKMRTCSTVLGAAVLTAGASLAALWPRATLADGDKDPMQELEGDGTKLDNVVVTGNVVRDPKAKTGWVVELKAENTGDQAETVALETDLQRSVSNAADRAEPVPTSVWKRTETITLLAGESVSRRYTLPPGLGSQLAASARAEARNGKQAQNPNAAQLPVTTRFGVVFQKEHA
jgi:hypothetical protein